MDVHFLHRICYEFCIGQIILFLFSNFTLWCCSFQFQRLSRTKLQRHLSSGLNGHKNLTILHSHFKSQKWPNLGWKLTFLQPAYWVVTFKQLIWFTNTTICLSAFLLSLNNFFRQFYKTMTCCFWLITTCHVTFLSACPIYCWWMCPVKKILWRVNLTL